MLTVDVYGHLVPGANREAVNRLPIVDHVSRNQTGSIAGAQNAR